MLYLVHHQKGDQCRRQKLAAFVLVLPHYYCGSGLSWGYSSHCLADTVQQQCVCLDLQEAERLSMLARLAVLDLTGNPLVTATDGYRLLLLYKLRSLKVLDGTPTDAAELQAAQGQHAGRLTVGMLVGGLLLAMH